MYCILEALMIIHNIVEGLGDDSTSIDGFYGDEDENVTGVRGEAEEHPDLEGDDLFRTGLLRRKNLLDYSCM
jgi:hypothetical protein